LAIAAQNLGKTAEAENHYRKALNLVDSPDIRYNLAGFYLQFGPAKDAIVEYNRIRQIEAPSLDLYYHLLHARLFAREPQAAAEIMRSTIALTPKASDHFEWIERLYRRHHKPHIAYMCYELLITQWTKDPEQMEPARKRLQQLKSIQ